MKYYNFIKIIFFNLVLLYFFLYILELFINFNNNKIFQKTRLYYLNKDSKKLDEKIYLNFGAYKLIEKGGDILPLSGYENAKILLCLDENNNPVYFNSDINGFNNNESDKKNILLIGDSYVQGMCVNNKNNLNEQFKKFNLNTSSLGVGGNGPLLEFATFKEYKLDFNLKSIVLFITPDNDFYDLSNEKNNKILKNYLNDDNFKQNLSTEQNRKRKIEILDGYFGNKTNRLWNDFFTVYHFNLKQVGNLIEDLFKKKNLSNDEYLYLQSQEIDELFIKILDRFVEETKKDNINFYVIFNSVTPDILYPKTLGQKKFNKLVNDKVILIKSHLKKQNINFLDTTDYFSNIKNLKDYYPLGYVGHFNRKGYKKVADILKEKILN